jgi:hypothetical protein
MFACPSFSWLTDFLEITMARQVRGQVTTTRCEGEVLEVRPANSKPDRGIARLRYQAKTSATIRFCPSSSFICCADGR